MPKTRYLAITMLDTSKDKPLFVGRKREGNYEMYTRENGWVDAPLLYSIDIGEFNDYEDISESEAVSIIRSGQFGR
jgi:hypothetical protein